MMFGNLGIERIYETTPFKDSVWVLWIICKTTKKSKHWSILCLFLFWSWGAALFKHTFSKSWETVELEMLPLITQSEDTDRRSLICTLELPANVSIRPWNVGGITTFMLWGDRANRWVTIVISQPKGGKELKVSIHQWFSPHVSCTGLLGAEGASYTWTGCQAILVLM